ncbi:MAG: hypothetical protein AB9897_03490 [Anaerolineaceae bacterium]
MKFFKTIGEYFNLLSEYEASDESKKHPAAWPQYLVLVLGMLVQPCFAASQQGLALILPGEYILVIIAIVSGLLLLPAVYKNSIDPDKPMIMQLCLIFTAGVGWQSFIAAVAGLR